MNKNKNRAMRVFLLSAVLCGGVMSANAQESKKATTADSTATQVNGKEVKNRNVMLGAGDSTTP